MKAIFLTTTMALSLLGASAGWAAEPPKAEPNMQKVHQLLVYPAVGNDMDNASYQRSANAKPLNKAMMAWFFKYYGGDPATPYALPLKASSLKGMPPATVIAAEIDPLLTEGKEYADRLRKDGVPVTYKEYKGVTHEFFGMGAVVPEAKEAEQFAADELKKAFAGKR
ncbi:hypothetical protein GCM10027321_10790 [Massilia terrae]|uniref:Alpha/beta hydrolase n=1 Tax=Massilia terrae TaxID=1811224 RepID=A0ABT2D269_9BURK|nr:alpha/beta hydrolase [Massilia terrae]MCS0660312.1 alpha/beta hydrolase [Massilia terrae]